MYICVCVDLGCHPATLRRLRTSKRAQGGRRVGRREGDVKAALRVGEMVVRHLVLLVLLSFHSPALPSSPWRTFWSIPLRF